MRTIKVMLVLEAGDHKGDVFETFLEEI